MSEQKPSEEMSLSEEMALRLTPYASYIGSGLLVEWVQRAAEQKKELAVSRQATVEATNALNELETQTGHTHGGRWTPEMFRDIAAEILIIREAENDANTEE